MPKRKAFEKSYLYINSYKELKEVVMMQYGEINCPFIQPLIFYLMPYIIYFRRRGEFEYELFSVVSFSHQLLAPS